MIRKPPCFLVYYAPSNLVICLILNCTRSHVLSSWCIVRCVLPDSDVRTPCESILEIHIDADPAVLLLPVDGVLSWSRRRPAQSTSGSPPANMAGYHHLKISNVVSCYEDDPLAIEPVFFCHLCNRPFARKEHVSAHLASIHDNQRQFQCDLCSANFNLRYSLLRHQRRCFTARATRFACSYCPASYSTAAFLKRHLNRKHYGELTTPCREPLLYHLMQHNNQCLTPLFPCMQCPASFTKLFDLYLHVINNKKH
jgi:hypothetical protein